MKRIASFQASRGFEMQVLALNSSSPMESDCFLRFLSAHTSTHAQSLRVAAHRLRNFFVDGCYAR